MTRRTKTGKGYYMISAVATRYNIHPQTLRLYEREGLLKPSRTEGNTRLYSDEDLQTLETILALTRDLGVNLAGVEIILNMRRKMERMQQRSQRVHAVRQARTRARPRRLGAAAEHRARADEHRRTSSSTRRRRRRRRAASQAATVLSCRLHHGVRAVRRDGLAGGRTRRRAPRRAVRVLAGHAHGQAHRRRAHPAALRALRPRQLRPLPERAARSRPSTRARRFAEAFPAVPEGPVPHRPARHRQDAHRRRRAAPGRRSRRARTASSTTCAICCASSARPTTRSSAPPRWTSCGR